MAIDFFGPGVDVRVLTPSQLSAADGAADVDVVNIDDNFLNLAVNLSPIVQSVELRIGIGSYMQGEIVIAPPYEVAMKLVESHLMDYGNVMLVRFGYAETGDASPPFALFVNNYPDVTLDPVRSTITFRVQGFFSNSARKCSDISWNFDDYAPDYALGVVREIARKHRVEVKFQRRATNRELLGDAENIFPADFSEVPPPLLVDASRWQGVRIQQVEDDFAFLNRILGPANASVFLESNKLMVVDFKAALASTPVATFRVASDVDTVNGIFPAIAFEIRGSWWFQHPAVIALEVREGRDPTTGVSTPPISYDPTADPACAFLGDTTAATKSAQVTKILVFPDGSSTQIAVAYGPREAGHRHFQSPRDPFKGRAERRARDGTLDMSGFKGTLRTLGLPVLAPMTLVAVEGVGRFSGLYQIESITHRIDPSGFITTLRIQRNTVADGAAADGSNGTPVPGNSKVPPFRPLTDVNAIIQGTL